MGKTAIATRQVFFITTPLIVIPGHFFLIRTFLGWAGRDAWLGIIAGFGAGFIIFLAMAYLNEKLYGKTLVERALEKLGPWFGRLVTLPLVAYFFILSLITLYGFSVFITSVFLPQHSLGVISAIFAFCVLYTVHLGIEVIVRVSEWIIILNILAGIFVSVALKPLKDYHKLLPILENGIEPIIPVVLVILALFGEMIVMLMINVNRENEKSYSYRKIYIISFIANLIIFPSTAAGAVAIFGETQAVKLIYPVESMVRLINVGYLERFDIYGLTIMSVSAYLRLALLHYGASIALADWFKMKDYRWINWLLGIILIIMSTRTFNTVLNFYSFLEKYYFYGLLASGIILLLCFCVFIISRHQKKEKKLSQT